MARNTEAGGLVIPGPFMCWTPIVQSCNDLELYTRYIRAGKKCLMVNHLYKGHIRAWLVACVSTDVFSNVSADNAVVPV